MIPLNLILPIIIVFCVILGIRRGLFLEIVSSWNLFISFVLTFTLFENLSLLLVNSFSISPEEYNEMIRSEAADLDNIGTSSNAGATTAALLLHEFVPDGTIWAHLDVAGTAVAAGPRGESSWKYFAPGATGVPLRALAALCSDFA